jgi:SAM-dependent methyltransferase
MVREMRQPMDMLDEMPDAFLPQLMRGQLIEAEHCARYWWLAQAVAGKRVLDAGCGTAHGSQLLAEAGASEVVGLDHAAALLEAAQIDQQAVELVEGDACALGFQQGRFEVVVAFGLLEQVADPQLALSELLRVLSDDGLIAVSVPPASRHDPMADEGQASIWGRAPLARTIEAGIAQGCRRHAVLQQRNWLSSAILDDAACAAADGRPLESIQLRKVVSPATQSELVTLILGSRSELPAMRGTAVITHEFAQRRWLERSAALEAQIAAQAGLAAKLKDTLSERDELARRLLAREDGAQSRQA